MSNETTTSGPRWRRCEGSCRRVLPAEEFEGDATQCRTCAAKPATPRGAADGSPTGAATTARPASRTRRVAPTGVTGRGDREVRVRRARLKALEALATEHPEEFERLLAEARAAESL